MMNALKVVGVAVVLAAAGCAVQPAGEQKVEGKAATPKAVQPAAEAAAKEAGLPAAVKELEPLAFMAGRWMFPTPNGRLINREHWMTPAGNSMVGAFQQMRKGGGVAFYEYTAIIAEPDVKDGPVVVTLYLRHMHPKLMIDEKRREADVFKLKSTGPNSATFVPEKEIPGGIESMTYRLDGPDKLVQELAFKPDSKEKNFSTAYVREK
ncbi:MAG: hypothetical protein JSR77_17595 [Planctomycetes bacterium]|nr:hypothetical protein [Planctomycetota bacterium]